MHGPSTQIPATMPLMNVEIPSSVRDQEQLDQLLSEPTEAAVAAMSRTNGDVVLLGAGGKMGPSLARMIRRAFLESDVHHRVIAVSRFSSAGVESSLSSHGIETIRGDLLDDEFIGQLPDAPNVVFMTGAKFGTATDAASTWATNVWLPSVVCRRYRRSRILAFSTGNVYPFVPIQSGGAVETDQLVPVGEYAMSALGRERMFEYFSRRYDIPITIVRLNYAVELRYGVLVDLAQRVLAEEPIDVSMGYANVIWQADANALALAAMSDADSPPMAINVAGPELLDVCKVCERFASLFDKPLQLHGTPARTALLNNAQQAFDRYGKPRISLEQVISWTADWLLRDGMTWDKPTHFESRDGKY